MRILPVMDLMAGIVVHGISGKRQEYRPIESRLKSSCDPLEVAKAFRDHFGFAELYLADLDALGGKKPDLAVYAALKSMGYGLWVDAGIKSAEMATPLADAGIERIVVGLETLQGPEVLEGLYATWGAHRIAFSLDLQNGIPLGTRAAWEDGDAWTIGRRAIGIGVQVMIVLDLARVGVGRGTGTEELCSKLAADCPDLEVIAGGGVRGIEDVQRLKSCGVRGVLVASALHDGKLRKEELDEL